MKLGKPPDYNQYPELQVYILESVIAAKAKHNKANSVRSY